MDVDGDDERYLDDYDDEEDDEGFMPETKIVLVGEDNLECESCLHFPPIYRQTKSDSVKLSFEIPILTYIFYVHIRALPRSDTRKFSSLPPIPHKRAHQQNKK